MSASQVRRAKRNVRGATPSNGIVAIRTAAIIRNVVTAALWLVVAQAGVYAVLPAGAISINKGGTTYYLSGNTFFQPSYGANGVYYRVVPTP